MPRHVVQQGECIASIAARYATTPQALLDRSANERLRDARPNPHVLAPGDVVDVPEASAREVDFRSGGTVRYKARVPKTHVHLALRDEAGNAAANKRCEVVLPGAREPLATQTDGDGKLEVAIAVHHMAATLRVWLSDEGDPLEIPLHIGHLDPIDRASGVGGRLHNLGYAVGAGGEGLAEAVRAFQRAEGLTDTGVADDTTRARLVERHGT